MMTTLEKRAKAACDFATLHRSMAFNVVWKKSRTWGYTPSIKHWNEVAARETGCGFDKLSAVVATFLTHLDPSGKIAAAGGAGINSVIEACRDAGWILKHTYNGESEDGFEISRV